MGTTWSVAVAAHDDSLGEVQAAIESCLNRVVVQMSTWVESSTLSRFNRTKGTWQPLPRGLATVLDCALDVARRTGGAYDPTIGGLVNLWGFGPDGPRHGLPDDDSLARALGRCGWDRLELDMSVRTGPRARQPGGLAVDLSSIARGYAVDAVAAALNRCRLESFLVEIGGELRGQGVKPDGQPWWVRVEQPIQRPVVPPPFELLVALHNLAVATSGDYRRGFTSGGRWYSHTLDPRTGRPVTGALASVTVIHAECMRADAWSTALTVLGPDAGMACAIEHGIAALFVRRGAAGLQPIATPALDELLE